jgi:hypothetical protein
VAFVGCLGSAVVAASFTAYFIGLLLQRTKSPRHWLQDKLGDSWGLLTDQPSEWMLEEELAPGVEKDILPKGSIPLALESRLAAGRWLMAYLQSMPEKFDKLDDDTGDDDTSGEDDGDDNESDNDTSDDEQCQAGKVRPGAEAGCGDHWARFSCTPRNS